MLKTVRVRKVPSPCTQVILSFLSDRLYSKLQVTLHQIVLSFIFVVYLDPSGHRYV